MLKLDVVRHAVDRDAAWDAFVERSNEGTIFHRLDFLAYHGERFADSVHHLEVRKSNELFAVVPLAILVEDGRRVARSPFGASVGGPCCAKRLRYREADALVLAIADALRAEDVTELRLSLPLRESHVEYSDTFRFALEQRGATRMRGVPCSLLDLRGSEPVESRVSSRVRRGLKKAREHGVSAHLDASLTDFWQVMEKTFERHGVPPTHSFEEFRLLHERFPERVYANVAYQEGRALAGIGCFRINPRMLAAFYLCSDPEARDAQPLTLVAMETLGAAHRDGVSFFDFGTTGRARGFEFKEGFGTVTSMREGFRLSLEEMRRDPVEDLYAGVVP